MTTLLWTRLAIAAVVFAAGFAGAWAIQGWRLDAEKAAFSTFRAKVEALGQAAEKAAKKAESDNLAAKKRADNENAKSKRDLASLYDAYRSLRDQPRSSVLPTPAPGAANPDIACFSRAALDRGLAIADGVLQEGAIGLIRRGDSAITDLNTARAWASSP